MQSMKNKGDWKKSEYGNLPNEVCGKGSVVQMLALQAQLNEELSSDPHDPTTKSIAKLYVLKTPALRGYK